MVAEEFRHLREKVFVRRILLPVRMPPNQEVKSKDPGCISLMSEEQQKHRGVETTGLGHMSERSNRSRPVSRQHRTCHNNQTICRLCPTRHLHPLCTDGRGVRLHMPLLQGEDTSLKHNALDINALPCMGREDCCTTEGGDFVFQHPKHSCPPDLMGQKPKKRKPRVPGPFIRIVSDFESHSEMPSPEVFSFN